MRSTPLLAEAEPLDGYPVGALLDGMQVGSWHGQLGQFEIPVQLDALKRAKTAA